jgi:hypothetical protein
MSGVILATGLGAFGATAAASVGTGAMIAAGIGAGTTLYGGAKSFSDANKARKRGDAAQRAVTKAVEEAKKRIDVNRMEQLSIAKEPYELMREAQLVQGATGLQAGVEGETRGAAATAGRIQMAQGQQQAGIRAAQAQRMDEINRLVAEEDARIDQQLAGIAMEKAAGAQAAMRDAEEDRAAYITQGVGTLGSIAEGLSSSYAEGNFGKIGQPNSKKMLSKKERAPFLAAEEEYDRMMAQRRADAEAFVPYEQEQAGISARLATPYDLAPENRVGSIYGHPDIPDDFGPHARNTMTMYNSFSEMPKGPRPPGRYSGLGFPSYVMYDQSRFE